MERDGALRGEELRLMEKVIELVSQNDWVTANKLFKKIAISPETAMAAKKQWGAQFLIDGGYNLSWAEEKYGKDWLNK